jgi:hypothetical protein
VEVEREPFKVWLNPERPDGSPTYMGGFYPSDRSRVLSGEDLRELGLPLGRYTVLVPKSERVRLGSRKWLGVILT